MTTISVCFLGCTEEEVRLIGGTSSLKGRVEICLNDEWGTVCNQMWDSVDASVVCRQLGLDSIGKYYIISYTNFIGKSPVMCKHADNRFSDH